MRQSRKELICSCNSVSRGEVIDAIRKKKASQLADIQLLCGAGIRCGRCIPIIEDILASEFNSNKKGDGQLRMDF